MRLLPEKAITGIEMKAELVSILDIQRMSSEDGPGLRTTAFFKGCPLSCKWCHNPESISFRSEVLFHASRCMGCGSCIEACPQKAVSENSGSIAIDRKNCKGCFSCCDACPTGAKEGKGKHYTPEALCCELCKDRAYFGTDGGVTVSGGEALMQPGCVEVLKLLREAGVGTAVDTCGLLPSGRLEAALPFTDILLFDVKIADSGEHLRYTGSENSAILDNLRIAGDWARGGGRLWIRTPVIPGATDSEANIAAIGALLKGVPCIERWELCSFNNLCAAKYRSLGLRWEYEGVKPLAKKQMENLLDIARAARSCEDTRATGAAEQEEGK